MLAGLNLTCPRISVLKEKQLPLQGKTFVEAMWELFITTVCSFLLLFFSGLPNASSADTASLRLAHPLFGKCTASDFGAGSTPGGLSFLQEGNSTVSDEDCMQLLAEADPLVSMAVSAANEDVHVAEETSQRITDTTTTEEIISQAKEVLQQGLAVNSARNKATLRRVWDLLSASASDSTVFVLGLGIEVFALSQIAKNVIVIEPDSVYCQEFLKSKAGACLMKDNVHIYCKRPSSSQAAEGSVSLEKEKLNAASGVGTLSVPFTSIQASKNLIQDLVRQQFGDVPVSALVVLGKYPLAKLLLMRDFLDQSTVILSLSRMTAQGLAALSESMRVLVSVPEGDSSASSSGRSMFLLQPIFSALKNDELWRNYATSAWELSEDKLPLQLISLTKKDIHANTSFNSASHRERQALDTYLDAYWQALKRGMDADLETIIKSLSALRLSAVNRESMGTLLAAAEQSVLRLADAAAASAGLQAYTKLLMDTLTKMKTPDEVLIRATICKLSVDAADLIASTNIMEKLKDAIEEACELAEYKPQLFLLALRLIHGSSWGEDSMNKALQILTGLKQLPADADVSALAEPEEA